jgi:hypothetical protein
MNALRLHAAEPTTETGTDSLPRCQHALELLLTHRGYPSVEVERVLADDPPCVFAQAKDLANRRPPMQSLTTTLGGIIAAVCSRCQSQRNYEFAMDRREKPEDEGQRLNRLLKNSKIGR